MRKTRILSCALTALLALGLLAGCASAQNDITDDVAAVDAAAMSANETVTPSQRDMSGVQGLIVRANSDEVNAARFNGTTVTDCVLTLGNNDASAVISGIKAAGINVYVEVDAVPAGDAVINSVVSVLDKYDVNGIELDFVAAGVVDAVKNDTYDNIDVVDKLVENTAAKIAAYETVYGHPIALSVRVAHDINTNYNLGYDVMTWVADGYVDMVCPSPIGEITDTNMFTRLWYSLLESYDVTLAPCMGDKIKTYADTKLVAAQNAATLAGEASALLSMGADKVCVGYNTVDDASLNVLGSYSKLLATDRRVVLTYTDIAPVWQKTDAQVPKEVSGTNKAATIRIPVGDVADGSNVTLKFGFKMGSSGITGPSALSGAEVYANSKLCTFVNSEACDLGYTDAELYCFSVPVEAVNDGGYIVAEIAGVKGSLNVYSAEVVVDAN